MRLVLTAAHVDECVQGSSPCEISRAGCPVCEGIGLITRDRSNRDAKYILPSVVFLSRSDGQEY